MKKYMPYIIFVALVVISFVGAIILKINQKQTLFTKNLFYMDTYINLKVYTTDPKVEEKFEEIDKIYKEYHELTDCYNGYDDLVNIHYINNNVLENETLTLDERLYDILKYSLKWKEESDGLFNVEIGSVIDTWKQYFELSNGIPSQEELKEALLSVREVKLLPDKKIMNNNPSIDLGAIAKGYVTAIVGNYLEENGFNKYIINAGGHVLVGEKYHEEPYKIGVRSPIDAGENLVVVSGENICVATSGSYERFYEFEGKNYNHIINPKTLYPSNHMISVTVVSNDSKLNDVLTTYLFLIPIDEGLNLINQMDGVEAIWFDNDHQVIKSEGFSAYE